MRKARLIILLAVMLPMISQAQRYIGIATSNWSGTNGMYLNPANIADSRHKFTIDLFSLNVGVNNNLAQLSDGLSGLTSIGDDGLSGLNYDPNQQTFSLLAPYMEVRGPGAMVSINSKHSIALTTRVRVMNQVHDFDQNLYRSIADNDFSNSVTSGTPIGIQGKGFNFTAHGWTEIGLSYGGVIYDGGQHFIKGGITARYLMGAAYVSMTSTGIDAVVYPSGDSVVITNTDIQYGSNVANDNGFGSGIGDFLGGGGKGFGADLGLVYEWRPDHDQYKYDMDGKTGITDRGANKYKLRASVSVVDLGSIKYKNSNYTAGITTNGSTATLTGTEIGDRIDNYDSLRAYAQARGLTVNTGTTGTASKVVLPAAMIVGVDYHAIKGLYVNAMFMANLANRDAFGNSYYNQITVTPRWDTRIFSAGIPLTYDFLTKSLKYGLGLRVGGFFLGSDDLSGIIGNSGYGANFYLGASIPINYKKPKDSDGDLVSNKKDKCKNEKGVWEEMGCPNPDKDGDGVLDKDDNCPDVAGSKTAQGCPDADLDGVADAQDRCPSEAGSAETQGCPDRDKDGVADLDDSCPDVPGLAQYKGCPDTDNDGVADNLDKCPEKPGPIVNEGCPDTDSDGVADNMDKCPEVPGTAENYGCPEVSVEVKKRLAFAATAIQFNLGKATIQSSSNKILNEIVQILNDYPDYNMTIDGYTDNTGNAQRNLELSKERANAVKDYFVSKGIAADRLQADGHGSENPVASNKTRAGRAKNRRVEMDLKLKN